MPGAMLALDGVTLMEARVMGVDLLPPHPASISTVASTIKTHFAIVSKMDNKRIGLTIGLELKDSSLLIGQQK